MRQARIKIDHEPTWYHCYNRISGTRLDRPFSDVEKEQFVRILRRVSRLYTVKVVAYQVMSNHFHLLLHAPAEQPDAEEMCRRYKAFHYGKRILDPDGRQCRVWRERSRDVSWFMRHVQQLFTVWFNRTRKIRRRGSLWADRFKHTLLESGSAVWACWTYIENNPVRAHMVQDAADYRFCSYGVWCQSGRHPFAGNVAAVALPMLRDCFGLKGFSEVRHAMAEALAGKAGHEPEGVDMVLTVQRRVRHWTQGLVIGSKLYVHDVMSRYRPPEIVERHRSARLNDPGGTAFYVWRRLRVDAVD